LFCVTSADNYKVSCVDYYAVIKFSSADNGNKTHVEWAFLWESDAKKAVEFCHTIYVALLKELSESFKK